MLGDVEREHRATTQVNNSDVERYKCQKISFFQLITEPSHQTIIHLENQDLSELRRAVEKQSGNDLCSTR